MRLMLLSLATRMLKALERVARTKAIKPVALSLFSLRMLLPYRLRSWLTIFYMRYFLPDRRYMEETLLPLFVRHFERARVLDVGTRGFCPIYRRYFVRNGCEYWSIDIDPKAAREFGLPGRHVTGSVIDVDRHFEPGYFDVVLLNGVFGYGVDRASDQDETLVKLRKVSRPGGVLLLGWDVHLSSDEVVAMAEANGFKHGNAMGLPDRKRFEGSRHVYDLFIAA